MDLYDVHWNQVTSYKFSIEANDSSEALDMAIEYMANDFASFEDASDCVNESVDWIGVESR